MSSDVPLERDLFAFIDPATETKLTEGKSSTRFQFIRNGMPLDFLLTHTDGSLVARHANNRKFASIRSLLASVEFADIRGFAQTQARMFRDFDSESLITPEGDLDGKRLAFQTLGRALSPQRDPAGKISVMLLDGPAGVGKTLLIQRLQVQRARAQQDVSSAAPILHVTSRGRRLSSLDDALAQSLQMLRAKFTFDQVPALIRHGLIQLAIDGFDELVDPEGYKDAWFALRDFFDETGFGGPIILAGRDTFFDQQSFAAQMKDSRHDIALSHARLGAVSPTTAKNWLAARGWKQADLDDPYADLVFRPGSYTLRPYFLNELAQAKSWSEIEKNDLTPRAYLVDRFIAREAKLVAEKLSINDIEVQQRLQGVFQEIALEMADTETDAVDLSFLQMVTEFAFDEDLEKTDVAKLRHKSGSFALLENDAREGYRRFPHTEISHHFLSHALIRLIASDAPVRFLRRGIVTSDFLVIFGEIFSSEPDLMAQKFIASLERMLSSEANFDRLPENVSSLLITSLCRSVESGGRAYADLQVTSAVLFGQVASSKLERVRFQRLDVEEASLANVEFIDCEVVNLFVDETTRFGVTSPAVHQVHIKSEKGGVRVLFDPEEITAWIGKRSTRPSGNVAENDVAVRLLDKVCRIMLRQHMIKDHDSDEFGRVLRHQYWAAIEEILKNDGLVDRSFGKQIAGSQAPFVRMKDPYALLANRGGSKFAPIWRKVAAIPK